VYFDWCLKVCTWVYDVQLPHTSIMAAITVIERMTWL